MIYEMRTYQVHPGKAGEFLKMYEVSGLPIISQYARLIGCWVKESGVLNSAVFIWAYDDFSHRTSQRVLLMQDPDWSVFIPKILPYLVHQESVFMNPATFSPAK